MKTLFRIILTVGMFSALMIAGCGEEGSSPTEPPVQAPSGAPTAVGPISTDAALNPTLVWHPATGMTGAVTYDVYFGTAAAPPLVEQGSTDTTLAVGPLNINTRYYWAIMARDSAVNKKSATFSFTTRSTLAKYPMATGNRWEYRHETSVTGQTFSLHSTLYYLMEVTGVESSWPTQPAFGQKMVSADFQNTRFDSSKTVYAQLGDGLYVLAHEGLGGPVPASAMNDMTCRFNGVEYASVNDLLRTFVDDGRTFAKRPDELIVENPPLKAYMYPLAVGDHWIFRDSDPFRVEKTVTGFEIMTVPAGEFGCFVIDRTYDKDGDGEADTDVSYQDYIAEQGLVKRTVLLEDVEFVNPGTGVVIIADVHDEYELLSHTLQP